jgi:hypothetical protein
MSSTASPDAAVARPDQRVDVLFEELAELTGQRNAINGRIVEIVAELDRDELWGATGARSVAALVAWKLGSSSANATTIATVAHRLAVFPRCAQGMREGRLSLDQVGVIAGRAADGSDEHYAELASVATVSQLRTAVKLEPRPEPESEPRPEPEPEPRVSITKTSDDEATCWRITLPHLEAAKFDAALQSHHDALIAEWKRDHHTGDRASAQRPPLPTSADAFLRLVDAGWDAEVTARPHGHHTTVVVHLDAKDKVAQLHLGPLLTDADRRYLTCDATCEVWFERHGQPIGAGRATRVIGRRLRRALEHRHPTCAVPGCGATRGLHAHHIRHWEDGGPTELDNLLLLCPFHHRLHHRGVITITGPPTDLCVTDSAGRTLSPGSLARPPNPTPPPRPPAPPTPTHGPALPRTHQRTRRLVVVPTLPTPTTTHTELGWLSPAPPGHRSDHGVAQRFVGGAFRRGWSIDRRSAAGSARADWVGAQRASDARRHMANSSINLLMASSASKSGRITPADC